MKPILTIGMATWDDYAGVWATVQAIRMYHREVADQIEILVVHNRPWLRDAEGRRVENPDAKATRCLIGEKPEDGWLGKQGRYIAYDQIIGTTAPRDLIFREAQGEIVLVIDPHVMLPAGALAKLIDYHKANPESVDLLHGPGLYDDLVDRNVNSHMEPIWREKMFGIWGNDKRAHDPDGDPFEIPMHGLGLFAMRKAAWVGMPENCRGFGGEEGNLQEKVRQRGGRVLCLPFLQWAHRFAYEGQQITYPNNDYFRIRNYLIWHRELKKPYDDICEHFAGCLAPNQAEQIRMEFGCYPEFDWLEIKEGVIDELTQSLLPDGDARPDGTGAAGSGLLPDAGLPEQGAGDSQQSSAAAANLGWREVRQDSEPAGAAYAG